MPDHGVNSGVELSDRGRRLRGGPEGRLSTEVCDPWIRRVAPHLALFRRNAMDTQFSAARSRRDDRIMATIMSPR